MAFFKFRFPGRGGAAEGRRRNGQAQAPKGLVRKSQATQTESVESLRQRARHRVIGASVLVLLAVIGFPMVFDTEPRPVGHVPLEVPERNEVSITPGHMSPIIRVPHEESLLDNEEVLSAPASGGVVGSNAVVAAVATGAGVAAGTAAVAGLSSQPSQSPQSVQTTQADQEQLARERAEQARQERERASLEKAEREQAAREKAAKEKAAKEKAERDKAAREKANKEKAERDKAAKEKAAKEKAEREKRQAEERTERQAKERVDRAAESDKAAERAKGRESDTGRFVIQVGSFADEEKAKAARTKLERAGITTYIQVINTKDGKRTRVRVGPFGSRSEADAAAKRVQGLGLYAGIAEL